MAYTSTVDNLEQVYDHGAIVYREKHSKIPVHLIAPCGVFEDFIGQGDLSAAAHPFGVTETGTGRAVLSGAGTTDATDGGYATLALSSTSEAQELRLSFGDKFAINAKKGLVFEARVNVAVAPTLVAEAVWGVANTGNAAADSVAVSSWFKVDGGLAVVAESDDTTNNNDDKATGTTLTTSTWATCRIVIPPDLASVEYYIDGSRVASATTFDMSNLTAAEAIMQPYIAIAKASGAGVGTLNVDYVACWQMRR